MSFHLENKHLSVEAFVKHLEQHGVTKGVVSPFLRKEDSNPGFVQSLVVRNVDYDRHEGVFFMYDKSVRCLYFVFVHRTCRGQAQGGTRFLHYANIQELLSDGLRLSQAMTMKNAVARIWWGGGKSIICPLDRSKRLTAEERKRVFHNFGRFVASLNGVYVAAEDMNTTPQDMLNVLSTNRFVTCLPTNVGGSDNPSPWTAKGVVQAMLATVQYYEGKEDLQNKTVLVQGVGNVGTTVVELVLAQGGNVVVTDPNQEACLQVAALSDRVKVLPENTDVYAQKADIFAPCAVGGVLNQDTINKLQVKYVVGAANNQLLNEDRDAQSLHLKKVVYVPDYFINRMGIINCANEQYGRLEADLEKEVKKVYVDVLNLLKNAELFNVNPHQKAKELADSLSKEEHPVWKNRTQRLVKKLVNRFGRSQNKKASDNDFQFAA